MKDEQLNLTDTQPSFVPPPGDRFAETESYRSRTAAILLAFFVGVFGIPNFYLGYTKKGILQVVFTLTGILAIVAGIMNLILLFKLIFSDDFVDADGHKLSR